MMNPRFDSTRLRTRHQRGVVLMVALIFLLLLTMLGVGASGRALLQQRMAGALRNASLADTAAHTALRGAEWKLWSGAVGLMTAPQVCQASGGCYRYDPGNAALYGANGVVTRFRSSTGWVTQGAATYMGANGSVDFTASWINQTGDVAKNPVYIIEDLGVETPPGASGGLRESGATGATDMASANRHVYRITARAAGADENTVRVMESTFTAKNN